MPLKQQKITVFDLVICQWRRFVFRAEILFLKMVHFGAFLYALNKV